MSNHYRKLIFFLALLGFIIAFAVFWRPKFGQQQARKINSFQECARAGYPVMESYPRQCSLPDGRFFVEETVQER